VKFTDNVGDPCSVMILAMGGIVPLR